MQHDVYRSPAGFIVSTGTEQLASQLVIFRGEYARERAEAAAAILALVEEEDGDA